MNITEDISKFIGIPYLFNGDTQEGADCSGLALFFYRQHNWKPDSYDKPIEREWWVKHPFMMERFLLKHFDKTKDISKLSYGDLILTKIGGESHLLIYLKYNRCLTTFPPNVKQWDGSILPDKSMIVHKDIWFSGFKMGFLRRK